MNANQRNLLVNRILAGYLRYKLGDTTYLIKGITPSLKYLIEETYNELYNEYLTDGYYTDEELTDFLIKKKIWSANYDKQLKKLKEEIEDLKVDLYEIFFKAQQRKRTKAQLDKAFAKYERLYKLKNEYSHLSASGLASMAKLRMTIGLSLYIGDKPVFSEDIFWETEDSALLDKIVTYYNNNRISDSDFRELARNEPWRSVWLTRKGTGENVFSIPSSLLTDEQRQLIYWTLLYDNIYDHPDCPLDEMFDDDDAIDGFLLTQKRKIDKERGKKTIEDTLSDKVKSADDVFIIAESPEEVRRIYELNDEQGKAVKYVREKVIKEKGAVNELDLPDIKKRLQLEINQKTANSLTNKG